MNAAGCPRLARAYRAAIYQIDAKDPVILHLDVANPSLATLAANVTPPGGMFLTACNPHSRRLRPAANDRRMQALAREIMWLGHPVQCGRSLDPQGQWPDEPSLWVPGLSLATGHKLARRFGQNAFLWCDAQYIVHLVWTASSVTPAGTESCKRSPPRSINF